jgi:hypothetical protein
MNSDAYNTFRDGLLDFPVATTYSDVLKIGKQGLGFGQSKLLAQITTAVTSAGASTTQFVLEKDDNEAFASPETVLDSTALGKATLIDNYKIFDRYMEDLDWSMGFGVVTYLRVKMINAVAALTAGAVQVELTGKQPKNIT